MGRRAAGNDEQEFYQKLGERIRASRQDRNFVQADLALVLGVTSGMVGQIERGETRIYAHQLAKISDQLGTTPGHLLGRSAPEGLRDEGMAYRLDLIEELKPSHQIRLKAILDAYLHSLSDRDWKTQSRRKNK